MQAVFTSASVVRNDRHDFLCSKIVCVGGDPFLIMRKGVLVCMGVCRLLVVNRFLGACFGKTILYFSSHYVLIG